MLIKTVLSYMSLENLFPSSKKNSTKNIIEKLKNKRVNIIKQMNEETNKITFTELKEELDIVSLLIKKSEKNYQHA